MASWSSGEPRNLRYAQPLVPPHTKSILCYGDSLTAGYCEGGFAFAPYAPALERALGGSVRVDHVGHSGMTATEMLRYADAPDAGLRAILDAANGRYAAVVLLAGTNDLAEVQHRPVGAARVGVAVWALHDLAKPLPTVCVSIPGSMAQERIPACRELARGANEDLRRRCDGAGVTFAECPVAFDASSGDWEADGLHMTRQGYASFGAGLAGAVASVPLSSS